MDPLKAVSCLAVESPSWWTVFNGRRHNLEHMDTCFQHLREKMDVTFHDESEGATFKDHLLIRICCSYILHFCLFFK